MQIITPHKQTDMVDTTTILNFARHLKKASEAYTKKKMPLLMPSINRGVRFLLTEAVTKKYLS